MKHHIFFYAFLSSSGIHSVPPSEICKKLDFLLCPIFCRRITTCQHLCCSSQKQSLELTSDLSILQMTRKELENQVGSLKEQHLRDSADLKTLLSKAENQAKDVQKEVKRKDIMSPIMVGLKATSKSDIHAS